MKKVILILLVLVLAGAATGWYMYNKPVENLENQEATVKFAAVDLFQEFSENEAEAMKAYEGKVLEISGNLIEQMENSDGSTTLILDGGDPIFGIKCRLDPSVNSKVIPQAGEAVRLKGLCIGMNADVEMNQCIIL
jgi:hypothetical protein